MAKQITVERIAKACRKAVEFHECSWSEEDHIYTMTEERSCEDVCIYYGIDKRLANLLYLAIYSWMSDTLIWAEEILGPEKEESK